MAVPDIWVALFVGTLLSLLFTEITGFLPAGLVVPGYLALTTKQPLILLTIFFISALSYVIVVFGIQRVTILYGKRKFAAMVTVGIILNAIIHYFYPSHSMETVEILSGIGVVVPGLIANTIQKQGFVPTILSTGLLTVLTFLSINAYRMFA